MLKLLIDKSCNKMKKTRMTHQRRTILEWIEAAHDHVTAETIFHQLKPELPDLSLSTVYRDLKALVGEGKVSVSDLGKGLVYEQIEEIPHHHLVCLTCHRIQQLDHSQVQPLFEQVESLGFQVATTHLCIFGYCENCR
jgi:Fe2+ or Zn2+ uptake regulation protein